MPAIIIRVSETEAAAFKLAAKTASMPVATWARSHLVKLAAPAAAAPAKPVGRPPKQTTDEFLDQFCDSRFPSGQRLYRWVAKLDDVAGDEAAHAANELDLLAFKASGKDKLVSRPHLEAYRASKK